MSKLVKAIAVVALLGGATALTPGPARAHWHHGWHGGWGWGPGFGLGLGLGTTRGYPH